MKPAAKIKFFLVFTVISICFFVFSGHSHAATIEDLRRSIDQKNQEIQKLETDIKKYQEELKTTQSRGKTLKEEIIRLDREIKKLNGDILLTGRQIQKKALEIDELGIDIQKKEEKIAILRHGLVGLIQAVFENDNVPLFALALKYTVLSDFFRHVKYMNLAQGKIVESVEALRTLRNELNKKKIASEAKKEELADLSILLHSQKNAEESTRGTKNDILKITKNQEKAYQILLVAQEGRRRALEDEVREIEAKIKITLDLSLLPSKMHGILDTPLANIGLVSCFEKGKALKNCITQFFGYTTFAAVGGYGGKGHNGVDFRADIGTPVSSAERGVVSGVGDTDIGCRKASYGKWILIKHENNLSTLYAHLSAINVSPGEQVSRGTTIGLSGQSGYATGPHLHFSVYATQAVSIESIRSRVCGLPMTLPISALNGYLNPLDYL